VQTPRCDISGHHDVRFASSESLEGLLQQNATIDQAHEPNTDSLDGDLLASAVLISPGFGVTSHACSSTVPSRYKCQMLYCSPTHHATNMPCAMIGFAAQRGFMPMLHVAGDLEDQQGKMHLPDSQYFWR
jgi:hypothetical protein